MTETAKIKPSDFELEVLLHLWKNGPATVRQVHDSLSKQRSLVYTTVLKTMQIMLEKGLLGRREDDRSHTYFAKVTREQVQDNMLGAMMEKAFEGSSAEVAMRALLTRPASTEELSRLRALLDKMEAEQEKQ